MNNEQIKAPGEWLDDLLTEAEVEDFNTICELLGQKDIPTDILQQIAPYTNSFMHLLYLVDRDRGIYKILDGEVVNAETNKPVDMVAITADYIMYFLDNRGMLDILRKANSERDTRTFSKILQGTGTNELTKIVSTKHNTRDDDITGLSTIKEGNFSIVMPTINTGGLTAGAYKLLDAITVAFTEDGSKPRKVSIALDEYMTKCGLKDRKEARKQIKKHLETLRTASMTFTDNSSGKNESYLNVNLFEATGIVRNNITAVYSDTFHKMIKGQYKPMLYPQQLWKLDVKTNSYFIMRKIAEHKNMNIGKKNEDIISVKTLLKVSPYIPSYKEVKETDRKYKKRIIDVLERDLDACADTFSWEYCHTNNEPLTEAELLDFNYDTFSGLNIHICWIFYPNQEERLAKKEERIAKKEGVTNSKKGGIRQQKRG